MTTEKYLSVSALTKYLKYKFDTDEHLRLVFLKGEISNFKAHSTGHLYFSIKDETSKINAIMFSRNASNLKFNPIDGTKVLIAGRVSVYEATGSYQIYVDEMLEDGVGNLYVAFEKLKEQLSKEGLFNEKFKKPIPSIPSRIGIITAPTGAAIKDILSTIKRRFPICETILFPSLVQGENAAADIVKNIELADQYGLDVLIVGRGGGAIEDLWPFNEEQVARAIFAANTPIISAVGHEIDFTISDFVADMRAPTPTGAAEMAVPNMVDLLKHINQLKIRLNENILKKINFQKIYLDSVKNSFVIKNPLIIYENKKQNLDILYERLSTSLLDLITRKQHDLDLVKNNYILRNPTYLIGDKKIAIKNIVEKLEMINPIKVLSRGYSITYHDNIIVKSIKNLKQDDKINIKMTDGIIKATVSEIVKDGKNG
ncbi:MAG: exodeoxyribonuclease VII large subunit [Bacilli bacterium]